MAIFKLDVSGCLCLSCLLSPPLGKGPFTRTFCKFSFIKLQKDKKNVLLYSKIQPHAEGYM